MSNEETIMRRILDSHLERIELLRRQLERAQIRLACETNMVSSLTDEIASETRSYDRAREAFGAEFGREVGES